MSLCNSVSRIVFKALSWKQRESKLLSHSLYEKNLPACDYPHKTIRTQSSPVLSQPRKKKPHELHAIKCRNNSTMSQYFCRKLSQWAPHPGCKGPLRNPRGFTRGLCCWAHSLQGQLRLRGCSLLLGELCSGACCLQGMGSALCVLCTLRDWLLKQLLASSCKMSKVSLQRAQKLTRKI